MRAFAEPGGSACSRNQAGYHRRASSLRAMTLVTAESVHWTPVLDLAGCGSEHQRHGLLLGQVRCGGEAPFPPGRTPCAKIGPSRTARRGGTSSWACVRLRRSRTPRPSPRHAVHVGSWTIARQAGGTPRGTARPHVESPLRSDYRGPPIRRGCEILHPTNRSRPRRSVSIPPGGAMELQREQLPSSAGHVTVAICARCGDVVVGDAGCRCTTPYDEPAFRRRHRDAVARARTTASDRRRRRSSNPAA